MPAALHTVRILHDRRESMKKKLNIDRLDMLSFLNSLVFYAPVALLVRTNANITMAQFFMLQAVLSLTVFLFEIPTGMLTDKVGYKNTMVLAQATIVLARGLLFIAYLTGSYPLFVAEAVTEGFADCFLSGTQDAYIYSICQKEQYTIKIARVSNFGTAGFIASTLFYVVLYRHGGLTALLAASIAACGAGLPCAAGLIQESRTSGYEKAAKSSGSVGMMQIFKDIPMIRMVFLSAGFSVSFLLINFFYVDKLLTCGIQETWISPIIIAYSVVQMSAERLLDRTDISLYQKAMFGAILSAGVLMVVLAVSQTAFIVVPVMIVLPLFLSFPEFILNSIENAYIDQCGQAGKRAAILSVANMAGNLIEIIFLLASACVARIGTAACFIGAGIMLVILGTGIYLQK